MKIKRKVFQPASDGWHSSVVADVSELGTKMTPWGPKDKLGVRYVIDEKDKSGKPIQVNSSFNISVHPTSAFFKTVVALTGTEPQFDTANDFDTDSLIGLPCEIETKQRTTSKGVFANVVNVRPLIAGKPRVAIPLDFQRAKRPAEVKTTNKPNGGLKPAYQAQPVNHAVEFPDEA